MLFPLFVLKSCVPVAELNQDCFFPYEISRRSLERGGIWIHVSHSNVLVTHTSSMVEEKEESWAMKDRSDGVKREREETVEEQCCGKAAVVIVGMMWRAWLEEETDGEVNLSSRMSGSYLVMILWLTFCFLYHVWPECTAATRIMLYPARLIVCCFAAMYEWKRFVVFVLCKRKKCRTWESLYASMMSTCCISFT